MVTEGADSLSLAAVCCVLPKGRANKAATPCTRDAVLYCLSLLGTFFGELGVGKEAQVSLRVHKLMSAILLG